MPNEEPFITWLDDAEDEDGLYWEDILYELQSFIDEHNPDGYWYVTVNNFGWQSKDGFAFIQATEANKLLGKVLPKTDCHFKIYHHGEHGMKINNAHHDSPMWKEFYYLT